MSGRQWQCGHTALLIPTILIWAACGAIGADLDACRNQWIAGEYLACMAAADAAIRDRQYGEDWPVLKAQAELATGRYAQAALTVEAGLKRYGRSVRLRELAYHALLRTGRPDPARSYLSEIDKLATQYSWRYTDVEDLVCVGRAALLLDADARDVLEVFFDRAKKIDPDHREPYLSSGQLALDKHDQSLAASTFQEAVKKRPDDPDLQFGLAVSLASSQSKHSELALATALRLNPNHVPSLILKVDQSVDSEQYADARLLIERILVINPHQPEAWAYLSLLAHLQNDPEEESACRAAALSSWTENPAVDHLIGRKLSQKYRFREGADHQRRALSFAPKFLPARIQLAQDLLRLGEEQAGWQLADAVYQDDGYDVVTFNLAELRDTIAKFQTLQDTHFIVRMEADEAAVYGEQVLQLLQRARRHLCKKYGLQLTEKTIVEIFPDQNDFAVRTFGMPAVSGYLGVCFGRVITANSPASQHENPSNWQSVLWHEFCHVVTLQMTRNRIPRWLSEGISVYEEQLADSTWGQRMNPGYRQMILDGELTPISRLSGAFLSPQSSLHLQFAYFESSLVVEFLVDRYGFDSLKSVLEDLARGLPINEALDRHTEGLGKFEAEFDQFARERALGLAPKVDWERHDLTSVLKTDNEAAFLEWLQDHPNNFHGLMQQADNLLNDELWTAATRPLEKLIELYPDYCGYDNPHRKLAHVYRELNQHDRERSVLARYAAIDSDALYVHLRLLELDQEAKDWASMDRNARRAMAVNPLVPAAQRALAFTSEKIGAGDAAISAYKALLVLSPDDPAQIHYRLAYLLHEKQDVAAKRHVLTALEHAPRFRDALKLLLQIRAGRSSAKPEPDLSQNSTEESLR